jgi:hypothetical protein
MEPAENTDRELYQDDDGNRVFVTEEGSIGMNVGGYVIVQPVAVWHSQAIEAVQDRG